MTTGHDVYEGYFIPKGRDVTFTIQKHAFRSF